MLQRRAFLTTGCAAILAAAGPALAAGPRMTVTKSPTCGCCTAWADLARRAGYVVDLVDVEDVSVIKRSSGIPEPLWGCHTAQVEGYVVEGHVPFEAVAKLLAERPQITGISAPGMPMGSPGMGWDPTARYDVIAFGGSATEGQVYYRAGIKA